MSVLEGPSAGSGNSGVAIGVDTGGTHTDLVLVNGDRLVTLKVPSTPEELSFGIIEGLLALLEEGNCAPASVSRFVYASTLVTNLIVEEQAPSVGLITTSGFRDVLEIGRASRKPDVYDIHWRPAQPLVPRHLRKTVRERIDYCGRVLEPLSEADTRKALHELSQAGVSSIAVCLLHAYANPDHEARIAELADEICPDIDVSISSKVVREFREYERSSTTTINAFVRRPIVRHLDRLEEALKTRDVDATPFIMRGNGGISTFAETKQSPVAITHSGPMGGIVGGVALAKACGLSNIITLDMGGTSADISLVADGRPVLTNRGQAGSHPVLVPMLDLITIGAGGGSIAAVEGESALRVGPKSAGSRPGPVCYGHGGEAPTVTDANLLAGRLNPAYFLAGRRRLDLDRARTAFRDRIANPLGLSLEEAALGTLSVAEAHMVNAIRLISVERGLDPRDFTFVAFGGAGPLHAVRLAEALSMERVLIPPAPGNLSAMGLLSADVRHDLVRTVVADATDIRGEHLSAAFDELADESGELLARDGVPEAERQCFLAVDLRYQGQNYELTIPLDADRLENADLQPLVARFHEQHRQVYGYHLPDRRVQIVNLRSTAIGAVEKSRWPGHDTATTEPPVRERRRVLIGNGAAQELAIYRITDMRAGHHVEGPAIVEYPGSTLVLEPGWDAHFDETLNAHLRRGTAAQAA